ncbi:MAG: glycosyltransferase [Rikenellaceae bacterium]
MRIVQINSTSNWGSTGRIAEGIGKLIIAQGWESYIAFGRYENPSSSVTIKIGSKLDSFLHGILSRISDRSGFYSRRATAEFLKQLDVIKPDIIHLHNIHGYYINIEMLFDYIKSNNIKVVWTLHDCWSFTGHCAYFEYVGCEKWRDRCSSCPQKRTYPVSFVLDNSAQNYDDKKRLFSFVDDLTLVPVSNWLKGLVGSSFLGGYSVKMIHNGIDLNQFKPTDSDLKVKYNILDKRVVLGVASIWEERKGLSDFVELSKQLDDNSVVVLIGVSKKDKKRLPDNIIALERTNSTLELAEWYSVADVFLNLTYEDNFPTTNLEALACGTPVITYKTGGSVESIDQSCGIVVKKGDIEAVCAAINTIYHLSKEELSARCRERAELNFDRDDRFGDYIKLYKEKLKID